MSPDIESTMLCQSGDLPMQVHVVGVARDGLRHREHDLGDGLRKDRVHLLRNRVRAGRGDLGRNGVLLLVRVVGDLRTFGIVHVEAQHVATEILGNDDGSVVLAA